MMLEKFVDTFQEQGAFPMGPRMWKKPWLRWFKGKATEVDSSSNLSYQGYPTPTQTNPTEGTLEESILVETPKFYFNLTTRCLEQVHTVSSTRGSFILKFNQEQCKYLVIKLQLAIQSASSIIDEINAEFLSLGEPEDMAQLLGIFKLLYAMGVEVENLIQSCCKELWMQSAIMLTSMSKLIASIGFNLEVCKVVFSARYTRRSLSLEHFDATKILQAVVEIVKEKVDLDEAKLIMDMKSVIKFNASSSPKWQLATFLLGRLEMATLHPTSTKARREDKILPPIMSSVKQMQDCLGRGAFGCVYKAMWLGVEVAKKTFYGPKTSDFLQEVAILDGLNHPNIVSLLWYISDEKRCHLVMELMDGDLFSWMQQRMEEKRNHGCPFTIPEALDLILQIGEGMLYLHEKRIVHRDLKSHNILIRCGKVAKGNVKYLHVKVADFGLSKTKERSATYSDLTMNVGTTRWMAPEVMRVGDVQSNDFDEERQAELNYPFKIDIYSFGMVCYEILTGEVPFSNLSHSEVKKAVLNGDRPPLPRKCPDRLKTLIESCWSAEASKRPSFGNICEELRDLKYANLQIYWKASICQCPLKDVVTIDELVVKLSSPVVKVQQSAADDIYLLATKSSNHHIYIKGHESIIPLLVLLYFSENLKSEKHAIIALQTLSIDDLDLDKDTYFQIDSWNELSQQQNVASIATDTDRATMDSSFYENTYLGRAIGPIVEVLKFGRMKARENAALALMKLSSNLGVDVGEKIRNSGAVPALVTLLEGGSAEGKEYAAIVLCKLCHSFLDLPSAVQAMISPPLVNLIAQHFNGTMLDDDAFGILVTLTKSARASLPLLPPNPHPYW